MKPLSLKHALVCGTALFMVLGASPTFAQTTAEHDVSKSQTVQEVIVTATKRSESVQHIPSSITALPEAFLKGSGSQQVEDIVRAVPGFAYTENSTGQAVLSMRGIQTSGAFSNLQSPVAIYNDEVPVLDPYSPWEVPQLQLFDVNRVEALKGPQGTLFGAGSLSGALRVISNKPNLTHFDAATEETVETTERGAASYQTNLMANIPLVDNKLAVRVVGYYDSLGGWVNNTTLKERNVNRAQVYGGRAEIEWAPTDNLNFLATISNEKTEPHDSPYVPYGSSNYTASNAVRNFNNDSTTIYNLTGTYTMPWATFTSVTSYLKRDAFSQIDFTGKSTRITGLTGPSPLIDTFNSGDFFQEVRLASSADHPYKWLIGGFFQNYHNIGIETIAQPGVSGLGYTTNYLEADTFTPKIVDQAVFGEASYDILPNLTATAGARYTSYSVSAGTAYGIYGTTLFDGPPGSFSRPAKYSAVTPKFSLSYTVSPTIMFYALADEGYRVGEANLVPLTDPFTGQAIPPSYKPDQLWNYEIGAKTAFWNHRLVVDADIYYIDWNSIQLQQVTGGGFVYTNNAGKARSEGVELQVTAKPVSSLEVGGSLSYNDAKLLSILPGVSATVGDQLPGSAKLNTYIYGQYSHQLANDVGLTIRMDYSYTGKEYAYVNNYNNPSALNYGDYSTVGAQAGLSFNRYEVQLFVRNLTNSRGRISARLLYPDPVEILQTPRTVGLTFRAHL